MKSTTMFLAAAAAFAPVLPAFAQGAGDKPISAVPPATAHSSSGTTNATPQSNPNYDKAGSKEGLAHDTGNVGNGPTPPRATGSPPNTVNSGASSQRTTQVNPHTVTGYQHGTNNVGDSSEPNGVLGTSGAGASATMENGQPHRH